MSNPTNNLNPVEALRLWAVEWAAAHPGYTVDHEAFDRMAAYCGAGVYQASPALLPRLEFKGTADI